MRRWLEWLLPWWWPFGLPEARPASEGPLSEAAPAVSGAAEEDFLGLGWRLWGRLAVGSWLVMFAAAWLGMLETWRDSLAAGNWITGLGLAAVGTGNALPGAGALLSRRRRRRLLEVPEAAALAMLLLSALPVAGGVLYLGLTSSQDGGSLIRAAPLLGILAFPLTFGLVFPLAIPLVCAVWVWARISGHGRMSRKGYGVALVLGTAGWMLVTLAGIFLGAA